MDVPFRLEVQFKNEKMCKLNKSLYDLKQSPRAWFKRFIMSLMGLKYQQSQGDHILFIKCSLRKNVTILIVYVDDIITIGDDHEEIQNFKGKLAKEFKIEDLGSLRYFLGIVVT